MRCCEGLRGTLFNGTCVEYRSEATQIGPVFDKAGVQYILRREMKYKETRSAWVDPQADFIEVKFTLLKDSRPGTTWTFKEPIQGKMNYSEKEGLVVGFVRESTGEDMGGMREYRP